MTDRDTPLGVALVLGLALLLGACGPAATVEDAATTPDEASAAPAALRPSGLPNPYAAPSRDWGDPPPGREWGRVSGVGVDIDGEHIWIAERCGGDVCLGSDVPVVLRYAPDGTLTRSFGADLFMRPHGMHVDADGNVWVTDVRSPRPDELAEHPGDARKGHQVVKFSPDGEVLMVLGTPGKAGDPPERLSEPNDVLVAPNGDIYVSQGHSGENPVQRISRFRSDGTYVGSWGAPGSGPGEFLTPHALALDARGRLFVADRGNSRVQIFDLEGQFLEAWDQFGRPSDVFVSDADELLTVDYESGDERNPGFRRGIYIGSAEDGRVTAFVPPHAVEETPLGMAGEGVVMDRNRTLYVGEVVLEGMTRYQPSAAEAQTAMPADVPEPFVALRPDALLPDDGERQVVLMGDPSQPGMYVVQLTFPPGSMNQPHFHDQDRYVTVVSGTFWVALGPDAETAGPDEMMPMPAGSFVFHPAYGLHNDGARDEPAVVRIIGMGPVTTTRLDPPAAP